MVTIRHAEPADHARVAPHLDAWWGGRPMHAMLPRLCGFLSQTWLDQAYVHFVGVRPDRRGDGLGRDLYERFFAAAREAGRSFVRCVTSPVNEGSVAFHRRLGFEVEAEVADYDGADEPRVLLRKRL